MKLVDLVAGFLSAERTVGQLLDDDVVQAQAVAATRFFAGWAAVASLMPKPVDAAPEPVVFDPLAAVIYPDGKAPKRFIEHPGEPVAPTALADITLDTELTAGEWALIRPLFLLYCEREQALVLESGRVMGVDVFGRQSSEIGPDIQQAESDFGRKAFVQPVMTI